MIILQSMDESNDLDSAITAELQYEKMLKELAEFLECAQARLNAEKCDNVECEDLEHLRTISKAHTVW